VSKLQKEVGAVAKEARAIAKGRKIMKDSVRLCPDEIMALQAQGNEELKCQSWQVIETAPKDGSMILGYIPDSGYHIILWDVDYWDLAVGGGTFIVKPTHWMALPEPPAKEVKCSGHFVSRADCGESVGWVDSTTMD
jgi:hypothetical protein